MDNIFQNQKPAYYLMNVTNISRTPFYLNKKINLSN